MLPLTTTRDTGRYSYALPRGIKYEHSNINEALRGNYILPLYSPSLMCYGCLVMLVCWLLLVILLGKRLDSLLCYFSLMQVTVLHSPCCLSFPLGPQNLHVPETSHTDPVGEKKSNDIIIHGSALLQNKFGLLLTPGM